MAGNQKQIMPLDVEAIPDADLSPDGRPGVGAGPQNDLAGAGAEPQNDPGGIGAAFQNNLRFAGALCAESVAVQARRFRIG